MVIFESDDYRVALKELLLHKKAQFGSRYSFAQMAVRSRIQKTYLSRVIKGEGHLSEDQVYLACRYLRLSDGEQEVVGLMHQLTRCEVKERTKALRARLDAARRALAEYEKHLQLDKPSGETLEKYYLDPHMQLVHIFLSIDSYAEHHERIGRDLGISDEQLAHVLATLTEIKVIEYRNDRYYVLKDFIHLPEESPLARNFRVATRLKAIQKIQTDSKEDHHFSVVFSADDEGDQRVRAAFTDFLKEVEAIVRAAPAEKVFQMNFDLLRWAR